MSQSTVSKIAVAIAATLGIACCIAGGVMYHKFPDMAKKKIEESLPLSNGSESAKLWEESSVPLYWKVNFFNITNPDEVRINEKPILQEVGPFVFRLVKTKTGIDWRNGTVFYRDHRQYIPDSGPDLDTPINHFNILYMGIVEKLLVHKQLKSLPGKAKQILEQVLDKIKPNITLVETHSVWEILFGGFKSDLITELSSGTIPKGTFIDSFIAKALANEMKQKFPGGVFGLYYNKNDTDQHSYEVKTGETEVQDLGKIKKYDDKNDLGKTWGGVNDTYCNMLNGTDGTMFGPGVTKEQSVYAFTAELCRSVHFEYEKEVSIQDIVAYKFILPIALLQDKDLNPDNECFCREDYCITGTIKISPTCPDDNGGIVFSAPHFYLGNESLLDAVEGLKPTKELHESFINVEPNTGIGLGAAKRLQVNIHLRNLDLPLLEDAEERVVPIAWVEESGEIDPASAKTFRSKVTDSLYMYPKLFIGLIAVGSFFILLSTIVCIYKRRR